MLRNDANITPKASQNGAKMESKTGTDTCSETELQNWSQKALKLRPSDPQNHWKSTGFYTFLRNQPFRKKLPKWSQNGVQNRQMSPKPSQKWQKNISKNDIEKHADKQQKSNPTCPKMEAKKEPKIMKNLTLGHPGAQQEPKVLQGLLSTPVRPQKWASGLPKWPSCTPKTSKK